MKIVVAASACIGIWIVCRRTGCVGVCVLWRDGPAECILHGPSGSLRVELGLISSGHKCHLSFFRQPQPQGSEMEAEIGHGD